MNRTEKVYAFLKKQATVPLLADELAAILCVPASDRDSLNKILDELVKSGRIMRHAGRYSVAEPFETDRVLSDILSAHGFSVAFPPAVMEAAQKIPTHVQVKNDRRDLRALLTFTIDGKDARDFDDAISIEKTEGGFRLYVHIADVSEYVKNNSIIDKEAYLRGTSCYLPDRVAPMLPLPISNGICSLSPNVTRLAVTTMMDIDDEGNVIAFDVFESVISSDYRLIYDDVSAMLTSDTCPASYSDVFQALKTLSALSERLHDKRKKAGSLDFDIPEPVPVLDENGRVTAIENEKNGIANRMIEDCMVLCNQVIAAFVCNIEAPFIYRIHEAPDREKADNLSLQLGALGIPFSGKISAAKINAILNAEKDTTRQFIVNTILLRSMMKAKYSHENLGHFGLALDHYCHFTSPIRRYPDLMCHRIVKSILHGKNTAQYAKKIRYAALDSSTREEQAAEAERDALRYFCCLYMMEYIGETFDAVISSVTDFGFFVSLPFPVEGLVHVKTLTDDYYIYDETTLSLLGKHTKKCYHLGDSVRVRLENVDPTQFYIDFVLDDDRNGA